MRSIKYKITLAISLSALLSLLIAYVVINLTLNAKFNDYLQINQTKRDERIIDTFRDNYIRDERWTIVTGKSLERDAESSAFTISLLNWDKSIVWAMDPLQIVEKEKEINPDTSFSMEQYVPYEYPIKYENQITILKF